MNFNYERIGDFKSGYFCGILPNADESRHEFKIGSNLPNIKDKVREKEIIKGPCHILDLIERNILRYRY